MQINPLRNAFGAFCFALATGAGAALLFIALLQQLATELFPIHGAATSQKMLNFFASMTSMDAGGMIYANMDRQVSLMLFLAFTGCGLLSAGLAPLAGSRSTLWWQTFLGFLSYVIMANVFFYSPYATSLCNGHCVPGSISDETSPISQLLSAARFCLSDPLCLIQQLFAVFTVALPVSWILRTAKTEISSPGNRALELELLSIQLSHATTHSPTVSTPVGATRVKAHSQISN